MADLGLGDFGKKGDLSSDYTLLLSFISFSLKMLMFSRNVREGLVKSQKSRYKYEECITLWVEERINSWWVVPFPGEIGLP